MHIEGMGNARRRAHETGRQRERVQTLGHERRDADRFVVRVLPVERFPLDARA
jgi:hypothetical protein